MIYNGNVIVLKNYFDEEEIQQLISIYNLDRLKFGTVGSGAGSGKVRDDIRMSKIMFADLTKATTPAHDKLVETVRYFNREIYNFKELYPQAWQFTQYDGSYSGFYKKHADTGASGSMKARKVSTSIQISNEDEYEGGELIVYPNKQDAIVAPKGLGTLTIFPSKMLHEAKPVTSGTRSSMICWLQEGEYKR